MLRPSLPHPRLATQHSSFAGERLQAPTTDSGLRARVRRPVDTRVFFGQQRPNPLRVTDSRNNKANKVTFKDVAGCDEAKHELTQVVEFLKNPKRFNALGAKMPKGCLLYGPPGTGKTMLARAAANEAGVPFFAVSASEFVEMYVGLGASRIRELFNALRSKAPCILFIDELDAVGRARGSSGPNTNEEREQTINQLLTEMDGFDGNTGIVVMAATNRPDILDPALLRPGRFDRHISVPPPDAEGRLAILKAHAGNFKLAADVDLKEVAKQAHNFVGAQLQNLLNEAAIHAAEKQKPAVEMQDIMTQLERMQVGAARKANAPSKHIRNLIACHEAGHALVAAFLPGYSKVHKVTIVPRGQAGGYTAFEPTEDMLSGLVSRTHLLNDIAVSMGGRVAEELMFGRGNATTGASNDFEQATALAVHMVQKFGFNSIGPMVMAPSNVGGPGPELQDRIDRDKLVLVNQAYTRAKAILGRHKALVRELANELLEHDSLTGEEVHAMVTKKIKSLSLNPSVKADLAAAAEAEEQARAKAKQMLDDAAKARDTAADETDEADEADEA